MHLVLLYPYQHYEVVAKMRTALLVLILITTMTVTRWVFAQISIDFSQFVQYVETNFGPMPARTANQWQQLNSQLQNASTEEKISKINGFFAENITYKTDETLWQQKDYWSSPGQLIGKSQGDCEDYAIAKYVALLNLGVSEDKLRLIYVKARIGGARSRITQAHMVLGYYATPNAQPLILDSLISEVLPAAQRTDLTPVFSFNSQGLWQPGARQPVASSTARLSRWRDVIERMKNEGIRW